VKRMGLACLCLPSPSHTEELHKFRLILPMSRTISNSEVYISTWEKGAELFGTVDPSCKDLARFYNGHSMSDGFWNEGDLFEPVKPVVQEKEPDGRVFNNNVLIPVSGDIAAIVRSIYGEDRKVIPEAVEFFIRNAHTGIPGGWINALNRFVFSLSLSGVEDCIILALCNELAPNELDKKDMYQIKRAIEDGKRERVEV
jgi:hypothetical protein